MTNPLFIAFYFWLTYSECINYTSYHSNNNNNNNNNNIQIKMENGPMSLLERMRARKISMLPEGASEDEVFKYN